MALERFDIRRRQAELGRLLGLVPGAGASALNVVRLDSLRVSVELCYSFDPEELRTAIRREDVVVIVFVRSGQLPTHFDDVPHAVVVTGVEDDLASLNDPAFDAPTEIRWDDLVLAWDEQGNVFAVVTEKRPR